MRYTLLQTSNHIYKNIKFNLHKIWFQSFYAKLWEKTYVRQSPPIFSVITIEYWNLHRFIGRCSTIFEWKISYKKFFKETPTRVKLTPSEFRRPHKLSLEKKALTEKKEGKRGITTDPISLADRSSDPGEIKRSHLSSTHAYKYLPTYAVRFCWFFNIFGRKVYYLLVCFALSSACFIFPYAPLL